MRETEECVETFNELKNVREFVLDLVRRDEDVSVVLPELERPHEAVQGTCALGPMERAHVGEP